YGHSASDTVLKGLTATVHSAMRNTDLFARYCGEEFILFLPQTSLELARLCMERIMQAMQLVSFEGLPPDLRVTMSVGIAQYYLSEDTATIIGRGDAALYNAKRRGRNRIELAKFSPCAAVR
ncbi:MAG TPA: GGDEF domain-containing protein, partial [Burkholderiaceae bacterium]|nr:GGDEF domain-containing protein [Burkholderiaceae bacterium]